LASPARSVGESPGSLSAHRDDRRTVAFAPRPFALYGVDELLIAWGMTLPDGSAVLVDWRRGPSSGVTISASPERAADLHGADLVWMPYKREHHERTGT
jgi:hypothetical protein